MFRKTIFFFLLYVFIFTSHAAAGDPSMAFTGDDRILVIAPHPDDEALGTAGVLQSAKTANAKVKVVYLTNGEANEIASLFYQKRPLFLRADFLKNGLTRQKEAAQAMSSLGLSLEDLVFFGYPDGGTLNIWIKHWASAKPYRSLFTRINKVPYPRDYSFGRSYKGDDIVHDFEKVFLAFAPTHIFVTAPFDLNSDHQGAYLYSEVALLNVTEQLKPAPQVYLYLVHAHHWPSPEKYLPGESLTAPARMDWQSQIQWNVAPLSGEQTLKKKESILDYKSQIAYKKNFLLSFARSNELFADYPKERLRPELAGADENAMFNEAAKNGDVVYRLIGQELWMDVPLTKPLDEMGVLTTYIFGYRKGFLFSEMPKLAFKLFGNKVFVHDGFRPVFDPAIVYKLNKNHLWIRIPLVYMKNPDTVFVSTRNAKEELSLDFGSWRILEIARSS